MYLIESENIGFISTPVDVGNATAEMFLEVSADQNAPWSKPAPRYFKMWWTVKVKGYKQLT